MRTRKLVNGMRTWMAGVIMVPLISSMLLMSADSVEVDKPNGSVTHEQRLEQQVEEWIHELAESGPPFHEWTKATRETRPLGPGTSAWIVLLSQNSKPIGYLIVGSDFEGSYKLIEYAAGDYPLFSVNTLHQALVQAGLISVQSSIDLPKLEQLLDRIDLIYNDPFEAVWEIEHEGHVYWFDAKTGQPYDLEASPADSSRWSNVLQLVAGQASTSAPEQALHRELLFDPFDHFNWLVTSPLDLTDEEAIKNTLLQRKRITFLTSILNGVKAPYAVTGFQGWGEDLLYLQIEHDGGRYIAFPLFQTFGEFYPDL